MEAYKYKRRKYDIEDVNELLEKNIELASHIHVEVDKCIHPIVLQWLHNYDHLTSGQPLSLYYALMVTIAHLSMESTVMQWNRIARFLNLYSIILGYSGSGSVRECREALEELYEFLLINNIGNPNAIHSILDKFTEAGFIDQDFLKHLMTDGAVVRCLFLVLSYQQYLREHHLDPNLNLPSIAQMLMAVVILGRRQYIYTDETQLILDNYIEGISQQASEADSSRITSFLANFQIRCKVISISSIRRFGSNKVFDGIVCDTTAEIKIVAFNEEVDHLYDSININQKITIENEEVQLADPKYRSPCSSYEIRLCPSTFIQSYECAAFDPLFKISKQELRNISELPHGVSVGKQHYLKTLQ
ncbi:unnamed protein product [Rotaria sp. Silwood2]|nr:unnamed protein product [Rotaria sp. Silwood2]CAF4068964.1 unnamed protein product [Rotaria sp. Silwood2]